MKKLSREEQQLLAAFERGALRSVITSEGALRRYQEYARATLGKPQRVNIRLSAQTLAGIRSRAAEEGMPYQTLMATVLHKYTAGRLVEKRAARSARPSRPSRKRVAA
jgi:predicted DNA binding CopG/RHH family protein